MIEFRLAPHTIHPHKTVVEIWRDQQFVASIAPDDQGAELRVISKWPLTCAVDPGPGPNMVRVTIGVR